MWFIEHKGGCYIFFLAKAQSSERLEVFAVCCGVFERCAFAKAVWVSFTLRLMILFVPFVVKMRCVGFSQRRGGAEVTRTVYFLCVLRRRFRRGCVCVRCVLLHASSYVFLCNLMWVYCAQD